jgi:hypothetical protein
MALMVGHPEVSIGLGLSGGTRHVRASVRDIQLTYSRAVRPSRAAREFAAFEKRPILHQISLEIAAPRLPGTGRCPR